MIINKKIDNLNNIAVGDRVIDHLSLEWYETNKRILHKRTDAGKEIKMKFLNESPDLRQDDVVYENEHCLVVIDISPCEAIIIRPGSMYQMASLCYEIGNKHLPLFLQDNEVLVPYEAPLFRLLQASGFEPTQGRKKLLQQLKTNVSPHSHNVAGDSLFSRILKLTTPSPDV